jgi:indolepyruvate ferredoxin oxidoreductase beta subunit
MKSDIILAGVGGQGILSIAAVVGYAAVNKKLFLKQSEVHGMSVRGGAVQSNLRLSDKEIYSDVISLGKANLIISVEPMEALRYLPWLSKDGWLVTNSKPFSNISDYPEIEQVYDNIKSVPNNIIIDAAGMASQIKSPRSSNMIVLGAAIPFLPFDWEDFETGINQLFGAKGKDIVNKNLEALRVGMEFTESRN